MNFADWYTDTMDVFRVQGTVVNNVTRNERTQIYQGIPCRVYQDSEAGPSMSQDAASVRNSAKVALDNAWAIKPGDELIIYRGGGLGRTDIKTRAFAGDPHYYFEPYGGAAPMLEHQQISLLQEERI